MNRVQQLLEQILILSSRHEKPGSITGEAELEGDLHQIKGLVMNALVEYKPASLRHTKLQFVPTDEYIDAKWPERTGSGGMLEGNLCRREAAKYIRDLMLGKQER